MKILFLDFDGVLNADWWFEYSRFEGLQSIACHSDVDQMRRMLSPWNVFCLKIILNHIPDLKIVISSTWASGFKLDDIKAVLSEFNIESQRIIGITPRKMSSEREHEIWASVKEHKPEKWLAIDDWYLGSMKGNFLQTQPRNGLTYLDAMRAIYHFNPKHFPEHHGKDLAIWGKNNLDCEDCAALR